MNEMFSDFLFKSARSFCVLCIKRMSSKNRYDQQNHRGYKCQRYIGVGKAGNQISSDTAGGDRHSIGQLGGYMFNMIAPGACAGQNRRIRNR